MINVASMTRSELKDQLSGEKIDIRAGSCLSNIVKDPIPFARDPSAEVWPEGFDRSALLRCLTNDPIARILSFSLNRIEEHYLFQKGDVPGFLVATIDGEVVQIVDDVNPSDLFALLSASIRPTQAPPEMHVDFELGQTGLKVFAAAVDQFRSLFATSLLRRTGLESILFSLDDLNEQLSKSRDQLDYRWLCAQLPFLAPDHPDAFAPLLPQDVCELTALGLLSEQKSGRKLLFEASDAFVAIAYQMINPLPLLILDIPGVQNGRIALMCGNAFWRIKYVARKATVKSIDGLVAIRTLHDLLQLPQVNAADPAPVTQSTSLQPQKPDLGKMSGKAAARGRISDCPQCGVQLKAGTKFCTHCGAPVSS